jgi:predicted RNA-binding protein associated with RNAse of E/G family
MPAAESMRLIRSGEWGTALDVAHYSMGLIDSLLIERAIWGSAPERSHAAPGLVASPGDIWYRFWLWRDDQIVEKYFDAQGQLLGTQVDLCMPMVVGEREWTTSDLLLDIWIAPDGRVTVRNEAAFEAAVADGLLSVEEARWAEEHVRRLTAAIAQHRFPPPIVRNWQVDLRRIQDALAA